VIAGSVVLDLSREPGLDDDSRDRRTLARLLAVPDGASVVVNIGSRRFVTIDAARWLHEHGQRLDITIEGTDPDAVRDFVAAARSGTPTWEGLPR